MTRDREHPVRNFNDSLLRHQKPATAQGQALQDELVDFFVADTMVGYWCRVGSLALTHTRTDIFGAVAIWDQRLRSSPCAAHRLQRFTLMRHLSRPQQLASVLSLCSSPSPDVDAHAALVATTTVGFGSLPVKLTVSRCCRLCRTRRDHISWLRFFPCAAHRLQRFYCSCGTCRDHNSWLRFSPSSPSPDVDAHAALVATTTVGFGSLPVKLTVSRC